MATMSVIHWLAGEERRLDLNGEIWILTKTLLACSLAKIKTALGNMHGCQ